MDSTSSSLDPLDHRLYVVTDRAAYVGIIAHAAFIPMFAYVGVWPLAAVNVASVVAWVTAFRMNRKRHQVAAVVILAIEVVVHGVLAVAVLGKGSGFHYYLLPLLAYIALNQRLSQRVVLGALAAVTAIFIGLDFAPETVRSLGPAFDVLFRATNLVIPTITLSVICYVYRRESVSTEGRLQRLASRDALTGLLNRRAMRERLEEEEHRIEREGGVLSVVLADIDLFKRVNDTYGHERGDDVLVETARIMSAGLRQHDVVARWGGEEFLVMLPSTAMTGASTVMERLREAIASHDFGLGQGAKKITMTFGVATLREGSTIVDCIRLADEALYRGKTGGRNRVVCAG